MTKRQNPEPGRKMDAAFKHEVVCLVLDKGMSVSEAARTMQIGETAVRRWLRLHRQANESAQQEQPLTQELWRIRQLEAENRQLREDNDILKKTSAFFARTLR